MQPFGKCRHAFVSLTMLAMTLAAVPLGAALSREAKVRRELEAIYARHAHAARAKQPGAMRRFIEQTTTTDFMVREGERLYSRRDVLDDLGKQAWEPYREERSQIVGLQLQGDRAVVRVDNYAVLPSADPRKTQDPRGRRHQMAFRTRVRHTWVHTPDGWKLDLEEHLAATVTRDGKRLRVPVTVRTPPREAQVQRELAAIYARVDQANQAKDSRAMRHVFEQTTTPDFSFTEGGRTVRRREWLEQLSKQEWLLIRESRSRIRELRLDGDRAIALVDDRYVMVTTDKRVTKDPRGKWHRMVSQFRHRDTWVRPPDGWKLKRIEQLSFAALRDGVPVAPPPKSGAVTPANSSPVAMAPSAGAPPEMKNLEFLVGKWTSRGTAHLPGQPPQESIDTHETTWILNGSYLQRRGRRQFAATPSREYIEEVMTYDPVAKGYRMWAFSENGPPREFSGRIEGGRLVLRLKEGDVKPPALVGIGAMLEPKPTEDGYIAIHRSLANTPAARAGLQPGDVILKVDGTSRAGVNVDDVVKRLRGEAGTSVRLTLRRDGKEQEVTLTRIAYQADVLGARRTYEPRSPGGFAEIVEARSGDAFEKSSERIFTPLR